MDRFDAIACGMAVDVTLDDSRAPQHAIDQSMQNAAAADQTGQLQQADSLSLSLSLCVCVSIDHNDPACAEQSAINCRLIRSIY